MGYKLTITVYTDETNPFGVLWVLVSKIATSLQQYQILHPDVPYPIHDIHRLENDLGYKYADGVVIVERTNDKIDQPDIPVYKE